MIGKSEAMVGEVPAPPKANGINDKGSLIISQLPPNPADNEKLKDEKPVQSPVQIPAKQKSKCNIM
jgi:hypothetical protein